MLLACDSTPLYTTTQRFKPEVLKKRDQVFKTWMKLAIEKPEGGKSGLHRARCQVTPGRREPTESTTENNRLSAQAPVRVKRCGKSAPHGWQQFVAR